MPSTSKVSQSTWPSERSLSSSVCERSLAMFRFFPSAVISVDELQASNLRMVAMLLWPCALFI